MIENQDPLSWWYPGFGEVQIVNQLRPELRDFLAGMAEEDPTFLDEYLIPALQSIDPERQILSDLEGALTEIELEEVGLSGLGDLGNLGKSLKKRLKKKIKQVKKVAKAVGKPIVKPVKAVAKDIGQAAKRIAKSSAGQAIAAPFTMGLSVKGVREGIKKGMASKYAAPVIGVVGAVAAPFTGGASLAAASILLSANQMYQAKKAAQAAKSAAKADAATLSAQADQSEAETLAQVDQFYSQNQAWFAARGIDQATWNSMTLDQKIATIDKAAKGQLQLVQQQPAAAVPQELPEAAPSYAPPASAYQGAGFAPTAGGGGGGGGGFAPMEPSGAPKVAQAGLFSGPLPLIMAAGALVYLLFGQKGHGRGRRTRRNPRRGSRWIVAA